MPVSGDVASITAFGDVTVDGQKPIKIVQCAGGDLIINANCGLTFDDASGSGILVTASAGSGFDSVGSEAWPILLQSASAAPSYPWTFVIEDRSPETRTIDLSYMECLGNKWSVGNDALYVLTNYAGGPWIDTAVPLTRTPRLISHEIDGRTGDRIYKNGMKSGVVQLSGTCSWDSRIWETLNAINSAAEPISVITQNVHLARGRIESPRFTPRKGSLMIDFALSIVEDI